MRAAGAVGSGHVHALARIGPGVAAVTVDAGVGADDGAGVGIEQGHAHGPGHAHIAGAHRHIQVEEGFARPALHHHAVALGLAQSGRTHGAAQLPGQADTGALGIHAGTSEDAGIGALGDAHHPHRRTNAHGAARRRAGDQVDIGVVARQHAHIATRQHPRCSTDGGRCVVVEHQHVDGAAHAHRTAGDAGGNQQQVVLVGGLHHHVVTGVHAGRAADAGAGVVADDADIHAGGNAHRAKARRGCHGHMREVVARAHQHALAGAGTAGVGIDIGPCADAGLGGGVDHVRGRADTDADRACTQRDGVGLDVVAVGGRDSQALEAAAGGGHGGPVAAEAAVGAGVALAVLAVVGGRADLEGRSIATLAGRGVGHARRVHRGGGVVTDTDATVLNHQAGAQAVGGDTRTLAHQGRGGLVGRHHPDRRAHADRARRTHRAGDQVDLGVAIGGHHHAALGMHMAGASAGPGIRRVIAQNGAGGGVEHLHVGIGGHAHRRTGGHAGGHGGDVFVTTRGDHQVAVGQASHTRAHACLSGLVDGVDHRPQAHAHAA